MATLARVTRIHAEAALDLVCGPDGPLPESTARYRLVQHLASGGQADVYRGVRLSGGVASAPVTVKVFRPDPSRALVDQLRSWDKGDAVLMDLGSRGVEGLCRRVDGFHGAPPHAPGAPVTGEPIPYQVLDYLSGWTLRDHLGLADGRRLDAATALRGLASTLLALHRPERPADCPVLHMDVKPSNLIVLPDGRLRLIDFTSARYDRRDHITSVAFTAEASAPEAFTGQVGSAYDVHGFGAVAYFLVTGRHPRSEAEIPDPVSPEAPVAPWAVLRRDPELDRYPALRDHLLAPLADRPGDRPRTDELAAWTDRLAVLAAGVAYAGRYASWGATAAPTVRARVPVPGAAPDRLARLEQEIVELRDLVRPDTTRVQEPVRPGPDPTRVQAPERLAPATARGSAPVTPRRVPRPQLDPLDLDPLDHDPLDRDALDTEPRTPDPEPSAVPRGRGLGRRRGRPLTYLGLLVLVLCWVVWAAFTLVHGASPVDPAIGLGLGLLGTATAFWVSRLAGRLLLGPRQRASAFPSHLAAAVFAVVCGLMLLSITPFSALRAGDFLRSLLPF